MTPLFVRSLLKVYSLDSLEIYCNKWNLTANVEKTKMIIFSKGGVLNKRYKWSYGGLDIEIVKAFKLGIVRPIGGSSIPATNTLKALRAMSSLLNETKRKHVPLDIMLNLFDAYVLPTLNYGCEVYGQFRNCT